MDEFFMEVDNKFRVSMEDSTMMCILHSAMNKAHAKVHSRDGVIERLNEQSKFYELAIIQVEACLMFVQEEEGNYILETTHNRLLFDLLEMKDKLKERLQETDDAIAEKDKELNERLENESRLRKALEAKEKELQCYKKCMNIKRDEYIVENSIKEDIYMNLFGETVKEMILYDQEKIAYDSSKLTKEGKQKENNNHGIDISNQVEHISESNSHIQRFIQEMPNLWDLEYGDYKYNFCTRESIQWCTILKAIKHCELFVTKVPKITHGDRIRSLIKELKSLLSDFEIEMNMDIQDKLLLSYDIKQRMDLSAIAFDNDFPCIKEFLDIVKKIEVLFQQKMNLSNSRLEKLNNQVKILIQQINSIKRQKLVYKTAFIQRCQNLQKAEIEVDILGDTVDSLTSLLKRIYLTLDHYSIVLQNFPEVWNMRIWIKKLIFMDDIHMKFQTYSL